MYIYICIYTYIVIEYRRNAKFCIHTHSSRHDVAVSTLSVINADKIDKRLTRRRRQRRRRRRRRRRRQKHDEDGDDDRVHDDDGNNRRCSGVSLALLQTLYAYLFIVLLQMKMSLRFLVIIRKRLRTTLIHSVLID